MAVELGSMARSTQIGGALNKDNIFWARHAIAKDGERCKARMKVMTPYQLRLSHTANHALSYVYLLIILVGILLRLYQIDHEFNYDEVFSVQAVSGSFAEMLETTLSDRTHPPLYHVTLYFWIRAFGQSEAAVRMLGVLASSLVLLILYKIVLRTAFWPAVLVLSVCSVSPFFVYYGQWARPYCLVQLFAVLSLYLLLKCQDEPENKICKLFYGLACSALIHTQYMGVFVLLPQYVALFFSSSRADKKTLLYGALGMISIVPWILLEGQNLQPSALEEQIGWLKPPELFDLLNFYVQLFGAYPSVRYSTRVFLCIIILIFSAAVFRPQLVNRRTLLLAASLAFLGPLIAFVLSKVGPISVWAERQLIAPAIFFVYLIGLGLAQLRPRLAIGLAGVLTAWFLFSLPGHIPFITTEPWRIVSSYLERRCPDCDVIAGYEPYIKPLAYYSRRVVSAWDSYKKDAHQNGRIAFICRPINCKRIDRLGFSFRIGESETVEWERARTDNKTIRIFLLTPVAARK
jgi:4-amino-4-deoxy-L-arabinose transferase-like glycosyltransferase